MPPRSPARGCVCLDDLRDVNEQAFCGEHRPPDRVVREVLGRELACPFVERGGVERGTAVPGVSRAASIAAATVSSRPSVAPQDGALERRRISPFGRGPVGVMDLGRRRLGDDRLRQQRMREPDRPVTSDTIPDVTAGERASGASGSARRSVSSVGSIATAASTRAACVAVGRAAIRPSTREARVSGSARRSPGVGDIVVARASERSRWHRTDCHRTPPRSARARVAGTIGRTASGTADGGRPAAWVPGEGARAVPAARRRSARASSGSARRARRGGRQGAGRRCDGSRRRGSMPNRRRATARRRSRVRLSTA